MNIRAEDARKIVGRIGAKLGHDFTYSPIYPEGRDDVCAVRHSSQDGFGYGFDTIYLVWRDTGGVGLSTLFRKKKIDIGLA